MPTINDDGNKLIIIIFGASKSNKIGIANNMHAVIIPIFVLDFCV